MEKQPTLRPLSDGTFANNARLNFLAWYQALCLIAAGLFADYVKDGLLGLGYVYTDTKWEEKNPGVPRTPQLEFPPDLPNNATDAAVRKHETKRTEVRAQNTALVCLKQIIVNSLPEMDKMNLNHANNQLQNVTTVDIITYVTGEYGTPTSADLTHVKETVLKAKLTTTSELHAHLANLGWAFRIFEAAGPISVISALHQTELLLESLSNVPQLHNYATEYITTTDMNNRTFKDMAAAIKKKAANAPAATAQQLGYAAAITRVEGRMDRFDSFMDQSSAFMALVTQQGPAYLAQATQQGPTQPQGGGNRKRKGYQGQPPGNRDNRPATRSGNKKPDAPATSDEAARVQALRNGPCPYHPNGTHLAKDCALMKSITRDF